MSPEDLPERWKKRLRSYLSEHGRDGDLLIADDFDPDGISLEFDDGGRVCFHHAFCLKDPKLNEIAVFTEHCGYHIFPSTAMAVEYGDLVQAERGLRGDLYRY